MGFHCQYLGWKTTSFGTNMYTFSTAPLFFNAGHPARATSAARMERGSRTTLHKGALFSVAKPKAQTVECLQGLIWITHDNHTDDIMLSAGQSHVAQYHSRMIVQGLEESEMRIHVPRERGFVLSMANLVRSMAARWAMVSIARRAAWVVR